MKILHIRASNFFGGPEKQIVEHTLRLRTRGFDPVICSFQEKRKDTQLILEARRRSVAAFSLSCFGPYDARQLWRLRALLIREHPDIVCTHDYRSTSLTSFARQGLPMRHIVFLRGTTRENLKVAVYHWAERLFLRGSHHVVVMSQEQRESLAAGGLSDAKVSVIPNAVSVFREGGTVERVEKRDTDSECADTGGPDAKRIRTDSDGLRLEGTLLHQLEGRTVIVTAGRLSSEKGQEYLVEAMPHVLARRSDVVLLIFGEGPELNKLKTLVERLRLEDSVRFLGFVPGFDAIVRHVDVFVLPSLSEGVPNVLLEAMAAGRPVVATGVGGVRELIVHEKNGLLVSPKKSQELAEAILRFLSEPGQARSFGEAARQTVSRDYSFEWQCDQLIQLYRAVAQTGEAS